MALKSQQALTSTKPAKAKSTRQQQLTKLLRRNSGATVPQIQKVFGWQPHTVRAAISTLRKAGYSVERRDTDTGAVYRIVKGA